MARSKAQSQHLHPRLGSPARSAGVPVALRRQFACTGQGRWKERPWQEALAGAQGPPVAAGSRGSSPLPPVRELPTATRILLQKPWQKLVAALPLRVLLAPPCKSSECPFMCPAQAAPCTNPPSISFLFWTVSRGNRCPECVLHCWEEGIGLAREGLFALDTVTSNVPIPYDNMITKLIFSMENKMRKK